MNFVLGCLLEVPRKLLDTGVSRDRRIVRDEAGSRSLASTSLQEGEGSGDGDIGVVDRVHHMHLHKEEEGIRRKVRGGSVMERRREEGRKCGLNKYWKWKI